MGDQTPPTQVPLFMRVSSAFFYAISSVLVIYANKIVLTVYQFPSFLVVAIGQMLAGIIVLGIGRAFGLISFPGLSRDVPRKIFPLPILYVLNLVTGLGGTQKLSLPMFTVLRRFTIFLTMMLEYYILGVNPTNAVRCAVGLMIAGALVAALIVDCVSSCWHAANVNCACQVTRVCCFSIVHAKICKRGCRNDLSFNLFGYGLILANDLCTASNGVYMKQKLDAKDLGRYGLLFYNSLFMLPFAVIFAVVTGDINKAISYRNWSNVTFVVLFSLSCVCGFVLNYATILCTQCNSALTTACVGSIKNLFVTYGGMLLMGDYIFSVLNFTGVNISVVGSILYAYVTFGKSAGTKPNRTVVAKAKARNSDGNSSDTISVANGRASEKEKLII